MKKDIKNIQPKQKAKIEQKKPIKAKTVTKSKDWYKKYFDFVAPKLVIGGCYTTHNVSDRWGGSLGQGGYAGYLKSLKNFETTFNDSGAGVALSFKTSEK